MTTEQLAELAEALSVLSAKSSVLKERDELRVLVEENTSAEEVEHVYFLYTGTVFMQNTLHFRTQSPLLPLS